RAERDNVSSGETIRDAGRQIESRPRLDPERARSPDRGTGIAEQAARGPAVENADGVRSRDVAGDGVLQRDRKLFAPSLGPDAGIEAVHAPRFFPEGLAVGDRRVARDDPADRPDV